MSFVFETGSSSSRNISSDLMDFDDPIDIAEEYEQESPRGRIAEWLRYQLLRCPDDSEEHGSTSMESCGNESSLQSDGQEGRCAFIEKWHARRTEFTLSEPFCNSGVNTENRFDADDESRSNSETYSSDPDSCESSEIMNLLKLAEILSITERSKMSQAETSAILQTELVDAKTSYKSLTSRLRKIGNVQRRSIAMCRDGHMAAFGSYRNIKVCENPGCEKKVDLTRRYWFSLVSDQLKALCSSEVSFSELLAGCKRVKESMAKLPEIMTDYYDGDLFKRMHGEMSLQWNEEKEINVFLSFSSDGFELFQGRGSANQAWPLSFTILNYDVQHRFRASNALLCGFVPGSHSSAYIDTFLQPIFEDIRELEDGVMVECHDGRRRLLRAYVVFFTADFPAASKILGFSGHNAKLFCRHCMKEARYVPGLGGIKALPDVSEELKKSVLRAPSSSSVDEWMAIECPRKRTSTEVKEVWESLELSSMTGNRFTPTRKSIIGTTGIKRKPIVSILMLDYVKSFPYDPMHLCLLGFVKHTLYLCLGLDKRSCTLNAPYIIDKNVIAEIDETLRKSGGYIPSSWGRAPLSLEDINKYKAEDYKMMALYYAPILFSGGEIDLRLSQLWHLISRMMHIVFDPTPDVGCVGELKIIVVTIHALFSDIFFLDERYGFCFTPTTHAVLHLPEMLNDCGPLIGVSQFLTERLVGELGSLVRSKRRPEANLFHKTHLLFSLRILSGGIEECFWKRREISEKKVILEYSTFDPNDAESAQYVLMRLGKGKKVSGSSRRTAATSHISLILPPGSVDVSVNQIIKHERITILNDDLESVAEVETMGTYRKRMTRQNDLTRQKFCVACNFTGGEMGTENETDDVNVYYGYVDEFWEVSFSFLDFYNSSQKNGTITLVRICWETKMERDGRSALFYAKRTSRSNSLRTEGHDKTVEHVSCINRNIGFMDIYCRRYYIDPNHVGLDLFHSNGSVKMCGLSKD